MSFEELEEDINQKTNNLENHDWFTHIDLDIQEYIFLYIKTLKSCVRNKLKCKKFRRLGSLSEKELNILELNLKIDTFNKVRLRKILTEVGVNFKKYHCPNII